MLDKNDLSAIEKLTKLNPNLILDYYKQFERKYPTGFINLKQFNDLIGKLLIVDKTDPSDLEKNEEKIKVSERLFEMCDQDENGCIDFKEYFILFWFRLRGDLNQKLNMLFDLNSNGYIDFNEMHSIVKTLIKMKYGCNKNNKNELNIILKKFIETKLIYNPKLSNSYNIAMYIMYTLDTNRNARLTKDEFVDGCFANESIRQFLTPLTVFE